MYRALCATTEAGGGAELRPRLAGRWRICVQARIRPGRASAMRCIAATRHGSPLRGTRKLTEKPQICLMPSLKAPFKPFPWNSVSGEARFRVRWMRRRCNASQGLGDGGGHACMGRRNPLPVGRRWRPAATAASVVARSAPLLPTLPSSQKRKQLCVHTRGQQRCWLIIYANNSSWSGEGGFEERVR